MRFKIRKLSFGFHYLMERHLFNGKHFWQPIIGLSYKRSSLKQSIRMKRTLIQQSKALNKEGIAK